MPGPGAIAMNKTEHAYLLRVYGLITYRIKSNAMMGGDEEAKFRLRR